MGLHEPTCRSTALNCFPEAAVLLVGLLIDISLPHQTWTPGVQGFCSSSHPSSAPNTVPSTEHVLHGYLSIKEKKRLGHMLEYLKGCGAKDWVQLIVHTTLEQHWPIDCSSPYFQGWGTESSLCFEEVEVKYTFIFYCDLFRTTFYKMPCFLYYCFWKGKFY